MDSMLLELVKLVGSAVAFGTAILLAINRMREKRITKERGLEENPERCGRHEEAIRNLRTEVGEIKKDNSHEHEEIFTQLRGISMELVAIKKDIERQR